MIRKEIRLVTHGIATDFQKMKADGVKLKYDYGNYSHDFGSYQREYLEDVAVSDLRKA